MTVSVSRARLLSWTVRARRNQPHKNQYVKNQRYAKHEKDHSCVTLSRVRTNPYGKGRYWCGGS
jgi:hypothetical protein